MHTEGFVVWFTGLPSSGKSTLARALQAELRRRGCRVELLDGDEVRQNLTRELGFSRGVFSPLEGFLGQEDFESVVRRGRLANGLPWTIPIVLGVSAAEAQPLGRKATLAHQGKRFEVLVVEETYALDRDRYARGIFGTTDRRHPGVARLEECGDYLVGDAHRRRRPWLWGCAGGLTAMLLHSLTDFTTDFTLYIPANALVFALVLGLAWGLTREKAEEAVPVNVEVA